MSYSKVQKSLYSADANSKDAKKWQLGGIIAGRSVDKLLELFETKKERSKRYDEIVGILEKTGNKDNYVIPSKFKYLLGKDEGTYTDVESGESLPFNIDSIYGLGITKKTKALDSLMKDLGMSADEGMQEYMQDFLESK
tara:strand:- start:1772 stop:2188 length:417 start_codon:yes stop_codon:yes gene_type:complete